MKSLAQARRQARAALAAAVITAICMPALAQQNHAFHPLWYTRSAVSDQSTAAGLQPWVWSVGFGATSTPFILMAKKADDASASAWTYTFAVNLASAPDAVSWADGTNARQRIFYASAGAVQMLNWDNNTQNSFSTLPLPATYTIPVGDVAAVSWNNAGTQSIAVAAYAAKSGVNGYLCFWEKAFNSGNWTTACSTSAVLPASTTILPDIVGVVQGTTPEFFFMNANRAPGRARRVGAANYTIEQLIAGAPIGPGLFAVQSQVAGSVDLGVIRADNNIVSIARLAAPTTLLPAWVNLPALAGGAVPNTGSNVALNGTRFDPGANHRTEVEVVSNTGKLWTIQTTDNAGTWQAGWAGPFVPGDVTLTAPEQVLFALGASSALPAGDAPRAFLVGGGAIGADWATTLQEYRSNGGARAFRDHVRMPALSGTFALDPQAVGATESSTAGSSVLGLVAAIQRQNPQPWHILLSGSEDGSDTYVTPPLTLSTVPVAGGPRSVSDPFATHGGYGGHELHFVDLEFNLTTIDANHCAETPGSSSLVAYRRGFVANDIASAATFVVGTGDGLDHPGVGVTVDASDVPTVHVLYWAADTKTMYWKLAPGDVASGPFDVTAALPGNPAGVLIGRNHATAYGFTGGQLGGWPKVCEMNGSQTNLLCGTVGGGTASPVPEEVDISYGAVQSTQQFGCHGVGPGGAAPFYRCFDTQQPVAIAADPLQPHRLYAAYQATDPSSGHLAIYFTRNTDNNLALWTAPVRIASDATRELISPAITVDYEGTIVVTYSRINKATVTTPTDGSADVLLTWTDFNMTTWTSAPQSVSHWDADALPYHCERHKWFLGEYHAGDIIGNRAQHIVPGSSFSSGSELIAQKTFWVSRWFNLN